MSHIRKLTPSLVNKIAAGEVIERPASVVKELVENALDAGATRIEIALEDGGTNLIRVTDNGRGIERDDLPLAVAAHATSKIFTTDDLFDIHTLGFRGEALASIASVSHLDMVSRTADQLEAYELCGTEDGGDDPSGPRPCAAPPGTTVEVRNLFYNVPARRKFLRRPQTECSHATEQIARLSLAHPKVAFALTHNGRSLRNLPPTDGRRDRISDFYGAQLAECLLEIDRSERDLRIEALIAPPAASRASTKWQYLFLNGRYVTDRRIGFAIREAFRGLVENGRYAVVFIFLTADPSEFDVNVHPTKIEVRWRDAGLVQSQVLAALRETLLSHDLTPKLYAVIGGESGASGDAPEQYRARQTLADYLKRIDPTQARLRFQPPPFPTERLRPSIAGTIRPPTAAETSDGAPTPSDRPSPHDPFMSREQTGSMDSDPGEAESPFAVQRSPVPGDSIASEAAPGEAVEGGRESAAPSAVREPRSTAAGVMQIHNTYLVVQTEEGVVIIDQHALHERILYERFRERILRGPLESQRLLIPEPLEVSPAQAEAAERHPGLLATLGIELSAFGPKALAVQSFPALLHNVDIRSFVGDLLDKLAEPGDVQSEETLIHAALDMMACKAAVKAGDALTAEEIYTLLEQRHLTERASNCPHGRPTTLELTTRDLEKQFKRS